MSLYLLDTDTVSLYQHGHPRVCAAVADHQSSAVVISVMTVEEQSLGNTMRWSSREIPATSNWFPD